ncbi:MAG: Gfo/Idh/MocA family oxidoreductase [Paracoccaceae bacterium]
MFRWGILSTAKIGREQIIPAILDSDNGIVQGIASRDVSAARALADRFGVPLAFGSYDELLSSDQIDGVYIPLPSSQHIEWSLKAVAAGKHVLCEKPIAIKAPEIDELIAARDQSGLLVSEAFMVAYHPQWHKVTELMADGAIGPLRQVQGAFTYYNMDPANMRNQVALGGGGLPDIGVYPLVTTRITTGLEPLRVSASIKRDMEFGTDIWASIRADFGDFEMSFYCSTQMELRQHMAFHGERGWIEVASPFSPRDYGTAKVRLHRGSNNEVQEFRFANSTQYCLQVENFVRVARGGDNPVFTLENSRLNQRVIDAIYIAGETDEWAAV